MEAGFRDMLNVQDSSQKVIYVIWERKTTSIADYLKVPNKNQADSSDAQASVLATDTIQLYFRQKIITHKSLWKLGLDKIPGS